MTKHCHIPIAHGHVTWSGKEPPSPQLMEALNEMAEFAYKNAEKLITNKSMRKARLNHIAPYLPYGLKVRLPIINKKECREYVIGTVGAVYSDGSICCHDTVNASPDWFKPVLRPLSQLHQEIEHDGERFFPLERLEYYFGETILVVNGELVLPILMNSYLIVTKLIEWHFDVFKLIEQDAALSYSEYLQKKEG